MRCPLPSGLGRHVPDEDLHGPTLLVRELTGLAGCQSREPERPELVSVETHDLVAGMYQFMMATR